MKLILKGFYNYVLGIIAIYFDLCDFQYDFNSRHICVIPCVARPVGC